MVAQGPPSLHESVRRRDFAALIRRFDAELQLYIDGEGSEKLPILLNRSTSYYQLRLFRKALKDVEEVLQCEPAHAGALILQGKILLGLKQGKEAREALQQFLSTAGPSTDIALVAEAAELLTGLENDTIKAGTVTPLYGAAPGTPSAAPPQNTTTPTTAPGKDTPSAPKALEPTKKDVASPPPRGAASNGKHPSQNSPAASPARTAAESKEHISTPERGESSQLAELDHMHRLLALGDPSSAIATAVNLVNDGKCKESVAMLDIIESRHGANVAVYATRGTAKALLGDLNGAIADFDAAIAREPQVCDFYKRRAQALAASGREVAALEDLLKVRNLAPDAASRAESYVESAKVHHKMRDYRKAELDLKVALELAPGTAPLLSLLASCQVSQGSLEEGVATYTRVLASVPDDGEAHLNLGMALKEMSRAQEAEKVLRKAVRLCKGTPAQVTALRLLAHMKQGLGDHLGAVAELDAALAAAGTVAQRIDLRFLKGACYHALGMHRQAVEHYQSTMDVDAAGLSPETVSNMCLAFYQKEMALWCRAHLDDPVEKLCLDADLHPEFKELWCKKCPPNNDFVAMYRSIMQPQHPNWDAPRRSPAPSPADMAALLQAADALGAQVQYRHQGFLVNRRQQRMAGLAALEFAQMLARVAAARKEGNEVTAPDSGASVCGRGPSGIGGGGRGGSGSHAVGWRDAMELIVKWRQVAEPNDQVLWVDLLTEREFSAGFGSHTPMFTGQTKCVRYYMNFDRALAVVKRLLLEGRVAYDADNNGIDLSAPEAREALQKATTARDLWAAVGKDWWVVVPIKSSVRGGHEMEGTRLTVVNLSKPGRKMRVGTGKLGAGGSLGKDGNGAGGTATADAAEDLGRLGLDAESALEADEDSTSAAALSNGGASSATGDQQHPQQQQGVQPDSYEFSIRTPVTPSRWEDYDVELSALFDRLVQALADGDRPAAADAAVRFAYCWYNFMPLARGSALCGYVSLLGAFLAAEVPIRSLIPSGVQTDWEAILESSPDAFIAALKPWMWPPELEAGGGAGEAAVEAPCAAVGALPAVGKVLGTMRARLEALNGSDGPKI